MPGSSLFGDDDATPPETAEGVRVIGADEAAEVVEKGSATKRRGPEQKRFGDRPEAPPGDVKPAIRFPLSDTTDPSSIERLRVAPVTAPSAEGSVPRPAVVEVGPPTDETQLQHWTEPATGEVPKVLLGDDDDDDRWAAFSSNAPRWRDETTVDRSTDDLGFDHLDDGEARQGALDTSERPTQDEELGFDDLDVPDAPAPIRIQTDPRRRPPAPGTAAAPRPERSGARAADSGPSAGGSGGSGGPGEGGEPPPPGGLAGRDLPTAIGVGLGIAAVSTVMFILGPATALLLVLLILGVSATEFFTAVRRAQFRPAQPVGVVACVALPFAAYHKGEGALVATMFLVFIVGVLWFLSGVSRDRPVAHLAITIFGVCYVGLLGSAAALLLWLGNLPGYPTHNNGVSYLLLAVVVTIGYDVGGLFIGSKFGHTPLSAVSPNKTREGLAGGVAVGVLAAVVAGGIIGFGDLGFGGSLAFGIVCAMAAPVGDLAESMFKRDLKLKDMSGLIPGHGGVLDRFDAMLFVLPVAYLFVRLVVL